MSWKAMLTLYAFLVMLAASLSNPTYSQTAKETLNPVQVYGWGNISCARSG